MSYCDSVRCRNCGKKIEPDIISCYQVRYGHFEQQDDDFHAHEDIGFYHEKCYDLPPTWEEIFDYNTCSAYAFLTMSDIELLLKDCPSYEETSDKYDVVSYLIEQYGSDADVIQAVLTKKYPAPKFFWLCDFIDDNKRQEDYFRVRIWRVKS